jgi:hypothetical protein
MSSQNVVSGPQFSAGNFVRIRRSRRTPHGGSRGVIVGIDETDMRGPYLVRFDDGTQFRYRPDEIEGLRESELLR